MTNVPKSTGVSLPITSSNTSQAGQTGQMGQALQPSTTGLNRAAASSVAATTAAPPQRLAMVPGSAAAAPTLPAQLNVQIPLRPAFHSHLMAGLDANERRLLNFATRPPAQWSAFDVNAILGTGVVTFSVRDRSSAIVSQPTIEAVLTMAANEVTYAMAQNLDTGDTVGVPTRHGAPGQRPSWQATIQRQPTVPAQLLQGLSNDQQILLAQALGTPQAQWGQLRYSTYGPTETLEYAYQVGTAPDGRSARSVVIVQASVQNQQIASVTVTNDATGESVSAPVLPQPLQLFGQQVSIARSAVANDPELNAILTGGGPRNHVRPSRQPNGASLTFTTRSPNSGPGPDDREVTLHLAPSPGNRYQVVGGSVAPLATTTTTATTVTPAVLPPQGPVVALQPGTVIPAAQSSAAPLTSAGSQPTTVVGSTTVPTTALPPTTVPPTIVPTTTTVPPTTTASTIPPIQGGPPPGNVTSNYPGAGGAAVTLAQGVIDRLLSDWERTNGYLANGLHTAWDAQNPNRTMGDFIRDLVATATIAPQGTPYQVGVPGTTPEPWRFDFTLGGQNVQALLMFDQAMTQCDDVVVLTATSSERKEAHRMRLQYYRRHP